MTHKYVESPEELRVEIKATKRNIAETEKELEFLKSEVVKLEAQLRATLRGEKEFVRASEAMLKRPRPTNAVARWNLFKTLVRRHTGKRSYVTIYMDRLPDGRLSVKVGNGREFPKPLEATLRRLADSFKVYDVSSYGGGIHRGTRFYFGNIPYAKRKAA